MGRYCVGCRAMPPLPPGAAAATLRLSGTVVTTPLLPGEGQGGSWRGAWKDI